MATSSRALGALLLSVALTVALYVIPFGGLLAWPLVLVSTLAHELGHGLTALLCGHRFDSLVIYADASGMARHSGDGGRIATALIAAGGLVGPSLAAALLFFLGRSPRRARGGLAALSVFLLAVAVLWVRNLFGFAFVAVLAVAGLFTARATGGRSQLALVFLAVQLSLSVFSRADYLFTDVARTGAGDFPSDVAHIAQALVGPYWLWGGVCGGFSVAVLALGLLGFARGR